MMAQDAVIADEGKIFGRIGGLSRGVELLARGNPLVGLADTEILDDFQAIGIQYPVCADPGPRLAVPLEPLAFQFYEMNTAANRQIFPRR